MEKIFTLKREDLKMGDVTRITRHHLETAVVKIESALTDNSIMSTHGLAPSRASKAIAKLIEAQKRIEIAISGLRTIAEP